MTITAHGIRLPVSPEVADRQKIEQRIASAVVKSLLKAGFILTVGQGDEGEGHRSASYRYIMRQLGECDDDRIRAYRSGDSLPYGWIYFVYGNSGWDLVTDYTTNLEPWMDDANKLAEKHS